MSYRKYQNNDEIPRKKRTSSKRKVKKPVKLPPIEKNLLIVVITLIILGIAAVFSASAPDGAGYYNNPLFYPLRHLFFVVVGIIVMVIFSKINYRRWKNWVIWFSVFVMIAVAATLIPGIGKADYGASRWLTIGFIQIQPSEFCKFACILIMSLVLSKVKNLFDKYAWKYYGIILFMVLLIYKQPNMSMLIILFMTCVAMVLVAGLNPAIFVTAIAAAVPAIAVLIMKSAYQSDRIVGWLHPEADPQGNGYNIIQSWLAIASGGWWGSGLGTSKQKLYYLPVGYTDFVFSVIAEECGFIGITILVLLFLLFISFGLKVALRCEDTFGRLMAFGIVFNIGFQAFTNMCVASGVFPVTGVTLPLISYGGSSFIASCLMLGVLFNISRYAFKKDKNMTKEVTPNA